MSPNNQDPEGPTLNRRQQGKVRTRATILAVAADQFRTRTYEGATIRAIAAAAGLSTGAVFSGWKDKADLWREAMGCEPPGDNAVTRAAPQLLSALRGLVAVRPADWDDAEDPDQVAAWTAADDAIALALGWNPIADAPKDPLLEAAA